MVRILVSPALVGLADRLPSLRVAGALYAFLAAALFVVPLFASGFWPILLFTGAALMFWSALGPFSEAVILFGVRQHGIDYARVRLWGSAGFMAGSLAAARGRAAFRRRRGACRARRRLCGRRRDGAAVAARAGAARRVGEVRPEEGVSPIRRFAARLIAGTLTLGAHGVFYTFGTLYWQANGFSGALIGALWAYSVAVEVTLFGVVEEASAGLGRAALHPGGQHCGARPLDALSLRHRAGRRLRAADPARRDLRHDASRRS